MEQLKQQNAEQGMYKSLEGICYFYDQLKNIPAPGITCPQEDIIIPVDIEKVKLPTSIEPKGWRGTTILIPVTINGKTYQFIFDTGAGTSYMSQRMAKETGVRILSDSLEINSNLPGAMTGNFGTLENMQIGSITFHNSLITISSLGKYIVLHHFQLAHVGNLGKPVEQRSHFLSNFPGKVPVNPIAYIAVHVLSPALRASRFPGKTQEEFHLHFKRL